MRVESTASKRKTTEQWLGRAEGAVLRQAPVQSKNGVDAGERSETKRLGRAGVSASKEKRGS